MSHVLLAMDVMVSARRRPGRNRKVLRRDLVKTGFLLCESLRVQVGKHRKGFQV